jgi:two-component system phosphate regulon sensor histidine kinase PhoR
MNQIKTPRFLLIPVLLYIILTLVIIVSSITFYSTAQETSLNHEVDIMVSGLESILKVQDTDFFQQHVSFTNDIYEVQLVSIESDLSVLDPITRSQKEYLISSNQNIFNLLQENGMYSLLYAKKIDGFDLLIEVSARFQTIPGLESSSLIVIILSSLALIFISIINWILYLRRFVIPLNKFSLELEAVASGKKSTSSFTWLPNELQALKTQIKKISSSWQSISNERAVKERDLATIIEAINDGILILDRNNKISLINKAAFELYDVEINKWKNSSIIETLRNSDLDDFCQSISKSQAHQNTSLEIYTETEVKTLVADGAPLFNQNEHYDGCVILLHDISRLTRLEKIRKDFVANVSHEIKTPVTSIKGFLENCINENFESMPHVGEFLHIMYRQTNRLERIIEDLLSLSRIEQLNESIEMTEVEILSFVEEIRNIIEAGNDADKTTIQYTTVGNEYGFFNPNLMHQAIMNLMENAIKYGKKGGTTQLFIDIGDQAQEFTVKDDGQGISSRELPRLFERFYRVDKARSRQLGGTGLGLSIVKHIAQSHQGTIEVESTLGEGSIFTILIPNKQDSLR